jgi:hypothetical protein
MVNFSQGLTPADRQMPQGFAGDQVRTAASMGPCHDGNGMFRAQIMLEAVLKPTPARPMSQFSRAAKVRTRRLHL